MTTGEPLGEPLGGHIASVSSVAFSPGGAVLAAGAEDGVIRLWIAQGATWELDTSSLQGSDSAVVSLAFSPDGATLAAGSGDGAIHLWAVEERTPLRQLSGPGATVWHVEGLPEAPAIKAWRLTYASWRDQACNAANRNLTCSEWQRYMGSEPYRATCPGLKPQSATPCP